MATLYEESDGSLLFSEIGALSIITQLSFLYISKYKEILSKQSSLFVIINLKSDTYLLEREPHL